MTSSKTTQLVLYRAFQFFAALKAGLPAWAGGLSTADEAIITTILTHPAQRRLFAQMPPNDRRHAVAVVRMLRQAGYNHLALLQAAALHDVAKSMGQPILYRVLIVLFETFWPVALQRLAEPTNQPYSKTSNNSSFIFHPSSFPWWRRPFVIHAQHPAIGAAWAEEAGCEPLAVKLIARHQDTLSSELFTEEEQLLAVLQWADNLN